MGNERRPVLRPHLVAKLDRPLMGSKRPASVCGTWTVTLGLIC
jgi:hypothetical protein